MRPTAAMAARSTSVAMSMATAWRIWSLAIQPSWVALAASMSCLAPARSAETKRVRFPPAPPSITTSRRSIPSAALTSTQAASAKAWAAASPCCQVKVSTAKPAIYCCPPPTAPAPLPPCMGSRASMALAPSAAAIWPPATASRSTISSAAPTAVPAMACSAISTVMASLMPWWIWITPPESRASRSVSAWGPA